MGHFLKKINFGQFKKDIDDLINLSKVIKNTLLFGLESTSKEG